MSRREVVPDALCYAVPAALSLVLIFGMMHMRDPDF